MANTRTYVDTHADDAPKTATLGNGEFPKPQSAREGEGESWESKRPAYNEHAGQGWNRRGQRNDKGRVKHILI